MPSKTDESKVESQFFPDNPDHDRYRYVDACDNAFRLNLITRELHILKPDGKGEVVLVKPTDYERSIFDRHYWYDASVISEEIAYKLALNPSLSY